MKTILNVRHTGEAVIAAVGHAKFDMDATDRLREELAPLCADSETLPLLIDLSVVEFLPSATLGVLVELANRCRKSKRQLALIRLQPKLRQLLHMCALDQVFTIHDDEQEALASH